MIRIALALFCCLGIAVTAVAENAESPVGRKIENFTLKDYRGKSHSLDDFKNEKAVVIVFLGTECPLAKLYAPRLMRLADEYAKQKVAFVGINANRQDSITEVAAYARKHEITFPVLKDLGNRVADTLGAVRTPEVFLLDAKGVVRYWGRIDDQYGVGYVREQVERRDLKLALDELLAGKPISRPTAKSVGCYIGRIRTPDANSSVTYSNQIARLLQKRCVECHRPGQIAPFSLTDYDEVVGWAETIAEVVRDQRMPPWHASAEHGSFSNDRRMTDDEKRLIYDWVAAGAPKGDPKNLPKPLKYTEGWSLPQKPDRVVSMRDKPYTVPAEGVVRYQYFKVDPGFKEDQWIKMAEVVPGNSAVVHHVLVFARPPGSRRSSDAGGGKFLAAYVPGHRGRVFPKGTAKLVPAGSQLIFQVHYTPIGSVQQDISKLGIVLAEPEEITHLITTRNAAQPRLEIPPHESNYRVEAMSRSAPAGTLLFGLMPHMHLRGKSFSYEARYPDGKTEILLDVPAYDFNWQTAYRLKTPKPLPAGTRIHCVAHFDNSEDNLANPNPDKTVRWGDQTWNEMMIGYYDIAVPVKPKKSPAEKEKGAAQDGPIEKRAKALIAEYDANGDGKVTKDELPEKRKALFKRLDLDGDGKIEIRELTKALKQ